MVAGEEQLVRRAVSGDSESLATLLDHYGPIVRGGLRIARKWRSVLDPADVMQVTYLEAFLRVGQSTPDGRESFLAWLARIANNNLRDAIKGLSRAKRPHPDRRARASEHDPSPDDSSQQFLLELITASQTTAGHAASRAEAQQILGAALAQLPDDYRMLIELYELQGRSAAEVGAVMNRSAAAVYMLRARAYQRLRELLGPASRFFTASAIETAGQRRSE
jgi:RNA polymerase sigma-70 factor (ECF subfamily)